CTLPGGASATLKAPATGAGGGAISSLFGPSPTPGRPASDAVGRNDTEGGAGGSGGGGGGNGSAGGGGGGAAICTTGGGMNAVSPVGSLATLSAVPRASMYDATTRTLLPE